MKLLGTTQNVPPAQLRICLPATDNQIDQLTYELYNLTPEEIRIIETST